ncbi:class A beta-lactamase [Methylobacterium sp. BTF04]|uniref:class A beta-lactamase n=1 Tax=Methylobacterium sp. BTF04 TaxID=2708300 RepID=UPI0013D3EFD2|nr:class A beta-lactamase [Methylobacterium sp. BTF04]NEU10654.1 class A beta-lactamase [Methylobacterium sp. BTF04]
MRIFSNRRAILAFGALPLLAAFGAAAQDRREAARRRVAAIEHELGGRIGVAVLDGSGPVLLHGADDPFPLCSTFKLLATAAILKRVDDGTLRLDQEIAYDAADLTAYAPITAAALRDGGAGRMSLESLCAAAMVWSDNTAANLMLRTLGGADSGPAALTAYLRGLGDPTTRLDRTEPTLNTAIPGDPRDTTTPAAMAKTTRILLTGAALRADSRNRLESWMVAARTGTKRLRAGLPPDWIVGDKTGSGDNGTANVVAILRPPARPPLVAAIYMTGSTQPPETRDAAHAEIGRILAAAL